VTRGKGFIALGIWDS